MTSSNVKRWWLWLTLGAIVALAVLSVVGAFLGARRAKELFNSPALSVFWVALVVLLTGGLVVFARLRQKAALLLMHAGCVVLLVGAMWGSQAGHRFQADMLGRSKVPQGYMLIFEGQSEDRIMSLDQVNAMLADLAEGRDTATAAHLARTDFAVRLDDFRMEYYWDRGKLLIYTAEGLKGQMKALEGGMYELGDDLPAIRVIRWFKNFRIEMKDDEQTATDAAGTGLNPALELELTWPDGRVERKYIFEKYPDFNIVEGKLQFFYLLMPRDYFSDLAVVDENGTGVRKTIEVNDPLHYGGYYFYQSDYDKLGGHYTVLSVSSDTGFSVVFGGFFLLCVGACLHFWRPLFAINREKGGSHGA